jgi:ADP-ribose pyrophosphatase YjhB (NUDIX family)
MTSDILVGELKRIAEELRALSNNGLAWNTDPYQEERYHKILALAAQLLGIVDMRPLVEIERILLDDLDVKTPLAVVDTAVFDGDGRMLLIQRADNSLWAMPGGACDVGEAPATGGMREVWEETGYRVEIGHLIGVFDSRYCSTKTSRHLYHFLFTGQVAGGEVTTSLETLDVHWFSRDQLPWKQLSPGHEVRIRHALKWYDHPEQEAFFDREDWKPAF